MTPGQIKDVTGMAQDAFDGIQRRMRTKSSTGGFDALVAAMTTAYRSGLEHALGSEGRAWEQVAKMEDLLIAVLRYAPDGDLAAAKGAVAHVAPGIFEQAEHA